MQLNDRNRLLHELCISEAQLAQWKREGHKEASWRNEHERKMHLKWANDRAAFIQAELDKMLPPKERKKPKPGAVPIVSHRSGHGMSSNTQVFGESYG